MRSLSMEISWGNHTFFHSTSAPHLPPRFRFGLWGFDFVGSLTHLVGLLCDFCPLRQSFAQDFLQHIPHGLRLVFGYQLRFFDQLRALGTFTPERALAQHTNKSPIVGLLLHQPHSNGN